MRQFSTYFSGIFIAFAAIIVASDPALSQDLGTVAGNVVTSVETMPALVSALAYLLGLLLAVSGILKLKAHVDNPGEGGGQTPLRTGLIRLLAGGFMFALPILTEAVFNMVSGGSSSLSLLMAPLVTSLETSSLFGITSTTDANNVNTVLGNISASLSSTPGIITAIAYLLGLIFSVMGVIKVKEHVEAPEQTKLNEPVIRLLVAGALFALPTLYTAMFNSVDGSGTGIISALTGIGGGASVYFSNYADTSCTGGGTSTGSLICGIIVNTGAFPAFLTAIAYLFGLVLGFWGILKVRDHVLNPQQTAIWEGVSRFIAAGAFFALPAIIFVFYNTVSDSALSAIDAETSFNNGTAATGSCPSGLGLGLDGLMACFVSDIFGPIHSVLTFFAFVGGMILIMIGISRLLKSAQEGAKGPGGLGTIMTFIIGGALISYNDLMRAVTTSITGDATTKTYADLQYTDGLSGDELGAVHAVITAVIKFMILIGLISFVRGLFIVRDVAEGNQQASMMAAVTHIVGGALAVNLGPLLNAVQETLGISTLGVTFS